MEHGGSYLQDENSDTVVCNILFNGINLCGVIDPTKAIILQELKKFGGQVAQFKILYYGGHCSTDDVGSWGWEIQSEEEFIC